MQKVFLLIEEQNHFQHVRLVTSDKKVAEEWLADPSSEYEGRDYYSRTYQEMEVYGELPMPPRR